jgi:hypothetical protein
MHSMTIHIDTPENPAGFDPNISRRTFLKRAGLAAAAGAALGTGLTAKRAFASSKFLSGTSGNSFGSETIAAGETWEFDPNASTTVTVSGTLTVLGTLKMRPASSSVVHTLRLTGGNSSTGSEIYVTAGGKLDIQGSTKTAWKRSGSDSTWTGSDSLRVTPTALGSYSSSSFTLGGTPSSVSTPYGTFTAEVFNLTRNVVIEGTSGSYMKRIMFEGSTVSQTIKYAEIRYIGNANELGFYPLHFHKNGNATRGSLIEGVVVHHSDHHAFVPHGSHGMTFRNCVAYNIKGDAFWWDPYEGDPANDSDDILYENCLATDIEGGVVSPQGETAGFYMGGGVGNKAIGCVAACTPRYNTNSGFHWGSKNNATDNTWVFEDCVSHNHGDWGVFVWQNTGTQNHQMTRYVAYSNGSGAVKHGAYNNWGYHYIDNVYWGNGGPVSLHAQVAPPQSTSTFISWQNTYFGGDPCIKIADHVLAATGPTIFLENTFGGRVLVDESQTGSPQRGYVDFVRNLRDGKDLEASDFDIEWMQADSRIRVQRTNGTAFQIDGPNGTVSTISPFYTEGTIKPLPPAPGSTGWSASCGNN